MHGHVVKEAWCSGDGDLSAFTGIQLHLFNVGC